MRLYSFTEALVETLLPGWGISAFPGSFGSTPKPFHNNILELIHGRRRRIYEFFNFSNGQS
jgi:hypothetical protein